MRASNVCEWEIVSVFERVRMCKKERDRKCVCACVRAWMCVGKKWKICLERKARNRRTHSFSLSLSHTHTHVVFCYIVVFENALSSLMWSVMITMYFLETTHCFFLLMKQTVPLQPTTLISSCFFTSQFKNIVFIFCLTKTPLLLAHFRILSHTFWKLYFLIVSPTLSYFYKLAHQDLSTFNLFSTFSTTHPTSIQS